MKIAVIIFSVSSVLIAGFAFLTSQFQYLPLCNFLMCIVFGLLAYENLKLKKDPATASILIFSIVIVSILTALGVFL